MPKTWASFEDRVRETAQFIYGRPCKPLRRGGVNIDGVVILDAEVEIHIEMTEERTLGKARTDVGKLQISKAAAFAEGKLARCFCVINGPVTQAMKDAGAPQHINVISIDEFSKIFFDFSLYQSSRTNAPFGSSINPLTGESDDTDYVPVNYIVEGRRSEVNSLTIADWMREGKHVILLGEYGSGKSRCIREVFRHLSKDAAEQFCYPFAVNLRNSWGLTRGQELIRRHLTDLGLDTVSQSAIRAYNAGSFAVLLDGFDEIGSQAWSNDVARLKAIRAKSLEGVKDVILNNKGGVLITGREHYFPNTEEMFSALGLRRQDTIILRSKNEFTDTELLEYFQKRDIDVDIPDWLPRRPLICQTISDLAVDQFDKMFGDQGDEIEFWNHFIHVLCERDARIHVSFDPGTIFSIFVRLARLTRSKPANVGPISLVDLQAAFEAVTGAAPVEEASVMLQRLPSLGRVNTETADRQFVDVYILDGLRAKDIVQACTSTEEAFLGAATASWTNGLDDLGQRVLARDTSIAEASKLDFATRSLRGGNKVMACDLIASLLRSEGAEINFDNTEVDNGSFEVLNLTERPFANLSLVTSWIGELVLPAKDVRNIKIHDCSAPRVFGVTSAAGLPAWITKLEAENYDSVANVSRIKRIGLSPAHEILITIIRKTFFQKGSGRKEEALTRGLGSPSAKAISRRIINIMLRENLLTSFKGDQGEVYSPVRSHTKRMQKLIDELRSSSDPLWLQVGQI